MLSAELKNQIVFVCHEVAALEKSLLRPDLTGQKSILREKWLDYGWPHRFLQ